MIATLWDAARQTLGAAIAETAALLAEYGPRYDRWAVSYSGGKDSSAALAAVRHIVREGLAPPPARLAVRYADTKMELPPLHAGAGRMLARLRAEGVDAAEVVPAPDDRFFVYMLGRGVPPPSNTFRWCTDQLKIAPIAFALRADLVAAGVARWDAAGRFRSAHQERCDADPAYRLALRRYRASRRLPEADPARDLALAALRAAEDVHWRPGEKVLALTGVRLGESAARDQRIAASCSRDGAECGQGRLHLQLAGDGGDDINRYFVRGRPADPCDTLAPILHWRACHVWDFLNADHADCPDHGYEDITRGVADAYGFGPESKGEGGRKYEEAARTGCVGCNLASRDVALDRLVARPEWAYLAPLKGLRPLYAELKLDRNRLRKPGGETRKDGTLCANQNRMGPLTFAARRLGLARVKAIDAAVNAAAARQGRPAFTLIDAGDEARILELIAAGTWPDGWTGTEPRADEPYAHWRADGTIQLQLFE